MVLKDNELGTFLSYSNKDNYILIVYNEAMDSLSFRNVILITIAWSIETGTTVMRETCAWEMTYWEDIHLVDAPQESSR